MLTEQVLIQKFGEVKGKDLWKYVNNKNQGGRNNEKGARFENHVAIFKMALLMRENINPDKTLISAQVKTFIDDLVIEKQEERSIFYYQLKDVQALGWTTGDHPLEDDVKMQYEVATSENSEANVEIIVSSDEQRNKLERTIPADMKEMVTVSHFQNETSINNLIRKNKEFKEALSALCALDNPSTDKLDTVGGILMGSWASTSPERVALSYYQNKCKTTNPNYFKGGKEKISDRLAEIFNSIKGFSFEVQGGLIKWEYQSTDAGVISFEIGTEKYEKWENDIFNLSEVNLFEHIESHLL